MLVHLAINIVHGRAHAGAQVPLSLAGALFVYIVILAGPLVGLGALALAAAARRLDRGRLMSGALVFGLINHFIIDGSDHVAHVAAEWRSLVRRRRAGAARRLRGGWAPAIGG